MKESNSVRLSWPDFMCLLIILFATIRIVEKIIDMADDIHAIAEQVAPQEVVNE